MREILFRGKRIDNGEWVEGAFLNDRDGAFYICPAVSDISYGDNGNRRRIGCWYSVDPSTVGQHTGLADKNGKRIFEGDILKDKWGRIEMCIYMESRRRIMFSGSNYSREMENADESEYEVIGNIHDNPELLKEG